MKLSVIISFVLLLTGCAKRNAEHHTAFKDTVIQTGSRELASPVPCSNLVQTGNFGVGQMADGPFVLDQGQVFRLDPSGGATPAPQDAISLRALTATFVADRSYDVGQMNYAVFKNTLNWKRPAPHRIYAIQAKGEFAGVSMGNKIELHDVRGTLLGYFIPDFLNKIWESDYCLFFLTEDKSSGGPVEDFVIKQARIDIDECDTLLVNLPAK